MEAFANLDKSIFMRKFLDMESTYEEIEELDDYKSLEEIIKMEKLTKNSGKKKYYKFSNG